MPIGYEILCHLKYVNHKRNLLEKENCHLFNTQAHPFSPFFLILNQQLQLMIHEWNQTT